MKVLRFKGFPARVSDAALEALVVAGCRALRLRKFPRVVKFGINNRGASGLYYRFESIRDVCGRKTGRWNKCPGGYIEYFIPANENWPEFVRSTWRVLLHELAHFKDIGLNRKTYGSDAKRSRHDSRPCELAAENIANDAPGWLFASKEIMAIGLELENKKP